jgi:type IV pilus assembly protein PilC
MPKYRYIVKTKDARTIKDVEEASSREEIVSRLKARGFFIVSVKEAKEAKPSTFLWSHRRGKRSSVKLHDLALFARNLATTLSSGVTLLRSLEVISSQTESIVLEKILKECGKDVREGLSLKEAIAKHPKIFSPLWQGIVEVGEVSGNLPFVLEKLAEYLEIRIELERKILSALVYPAILIFAAIVALLIFFKFIIPKFIMLFEQFNAELPTPTKIIFSLSRFLEKNFFLVLIGFVFLIVGFSVIKKQPNIKKILDRISLKINVVFLSYLERLTSTMHILLESGLPLVYTLEIAAQVVGNSLLQKNLLLIKDRVKDGASLSEEFKKWEIFPLLISEMTKIGEETGTMTEVLRKVSQHYQRELSIKMERILSAFEPIIILIMGVIIGGVVISLFLPLFKIASIGGKGL